MDNADSSGVTYGTDPKLEAQANKLLRESVGRNKRHTDRDAEKMSYELGFTARDDLELYDPTNDWDTLDEVQVIIVNDINSVEPSLCSDDGNIRARSREKKGSPGVWNRAGEEERRGLTRHVGDDDNWGASREDIPLLGANDGPRKVCTQCKRPKGLQYFSIDKRNGDGLRSWCRACEKEYSKNRYTRKNK